MCSAELITKPMQDQEEDLEEDLEDVRSKMLEFSSSANEAYSKLLEQVYPDQRRPANGSNKKGGELDQLIDSYKDLAEEYQELCDSLKSGQITKDKISQRRYLEYYINIVVGVLKTGPIDKDLIEDALKKLPNTISPWLKSRNNQSLLG